MYVMSSLHVHVNHTSVNIIQVISKEEASTQWNMTNTTDSYC